MKVQVLPRGQNGGSIQLTNAGSIAAMNLTEHGEADLAEAIGTLAIRRGVVVAVAESLTSGAVASALGAAEKSSKWFAGGVVAYRSETKFRVLGVDRGPVVTAQCARQMAVGVRKLTGAAVAVAVTGVGGPGPEEGHPRGTVHISTADSVGTAAFTHAFDADPGEVVRLSVIHALQHLKAALLDID